MRITLKVMNHNFKQDFVLYNTLFWIEFLKFFCYTTSSGIHGGTYIERYSWNYIWKNTEWVINSYRLFWSEPAFLFFYRPFSFNSFLPSSIFRLPIPFPVLTKPSPLILQFLLPRSVLQMHSAGWIQKASGEAWSQTWCASGSSASQHWCKFHES